ncbi:hypothetical protein [Absidia glauca]|uniref:Uncharacterized protein n=1 Tax=Absidia glauca TaxID=4829 RepID=A0A168KRD4_ABSGL|nr:hypothetical protein [Absidia glauca]
MTSSKLSEFYRNETKLKIGSHSPPFDESSFLSAPSLDYVSTSGSEQTFLTKRSRSDSSNTTFPHKKQHPTHMYNVNGNDPYKHWQNSPQVSTAHDLSLPSLRGPTTTTHSDDDYEFSGDDDEDDDDNDSAWLQRSQGKPIDFPVLLDHIITTSFSSDLPFFAILTKFYDTTTNPMDLDINKLYDFLLAEIKITKMEEHVQFDITQMIEAVNRAYLERRQVPISIFFSFVMLTVFFFFGGGICYRESDPLYKALWEGTIQKLRNRQLAIDELWRANSIKKRSKKQKRQLTAMELKKAKKRYGLDSQLYTTTAELQRNQNANQALLSLDAFLDELKETIKTEHKR